MTITCGSSSSSSSSSSAVAVAAAAVVVIAAVVGSTSASTRTSTVLVLGLGGFALIQTKQKRAAREQRNKYKPRTEARTTPSNQTRQQADGFVWLL